MRKYDEDRTEFKNLLQQLVNQQNSFNSTGASSTISCIFDRFAGVIPNPNSGRTSKQSSFINVAAALRTGISRYNESVLGQDPKLETSELDGSLLSWSHSVYSTVGNIVGRHSGLNSALGKASLDEAKKLRYFATRPSRYNREISAVITEIKKAIPIVKLAHGDWAAREILRDKFQNARNARKRLEKKALKPTIEQKDSQIHKMYPCDLREAKPASGTTTDFRGTKRTRNDLKNQIPSDMSCSSSDEEDKNIGSSSSQKRLKEILKKRKPSIKSSNVSVLKQKRKRTNKIDAIEKKQVARNVVRRESERRLRDILRNMGGQTRDKTNFMSDSSDTENESESVE